MRDWFAVNVTVRHEKVISQSLRNKGFETFLPLYTRRHQYEKRSREFDLPLFPGYLFCRSELSNYLPILTTPGVSRIVGAGRVPIPVDNNEMWALQRAVAAGISMSPHANWQPGQKGRIIAGPLTGITGFLVEVKGGVRLVLSVSLLQRSVLLEIDSECVAPEPLTAISAYGLGGSQSRETPPVSRSPALDAVRTRGAAAAGARDSA